MPEEDPKTELLTYIEDPQSDIINVWKQLQETETRVAGVESASLIQAYFDGSRKWHVITDSAEPVTTLSLVDQQRILWALLISLKEVLVIVEGRMILENALSCGNSAVAEPIKSFTGEIIRLDDVAMRGEAKIPCVFYATKDKRHKYWAPLDGDITVTVVPDQLVKYQKQVASNLNYQPPEPFQWRNKGNCDNSNCDNSTIALFPRLNLGKDWQGNALQTD